MTSKRGVRSMRTWSKSTAKEPKLRLTSRSSQCGGWPLLGSCEEIRVVERIWIGKGWVVEGIRKKAMQWKRTSFFGRHKSTRSLPFPRVLAKQINTVARTVSGREEPYLDSRSPISYCGYTGCSLRFEEKDLVRTKKSVSFFPSVPSNSFCKSPGPPMAMLADIRSRAASPAVCTATTLRSLLFKTVLAVPIPFSACESTIASPDMLPRGIELGRDLPQCEVEYKILVPKCLKQWRG